ncbi:MAG: HD domain-containing protein, partial [Thiolinea sp.]
MDEAEVFYFRYWGKAKPCAEGGQPYHLLVYHSLDVAAVGQILLQQNPAYLQHLIQLTGLDA